MKSLSCASIVLAVGAAGLTTDQIIAILSAIVMIINIVIEVLKKLKESEKKEDDAETSEILVSTHTVLDTLKRARIVLCLPAAIYMLIFGFLVETNSDLIRRKVDLTEGK